LRVAQGTIRQAVTAKDLTDPGANSLSIPCFAITLKLSV
jgi:hypothetical protein